MVGAAVTCAGETDAMTALLFGSITRITSSPTSMARLVDAREIGRVLAVFGMQTAVSPASIGGWETAGSESVPLVRAVVHPAHCGGRPW